MVNLEHLLFQKVQQRSTSQYTQSISRFKKCNKCHLHGKPRASPVSEVQQRPSSQNTQSISYFRKCNKYPLHGIPRASPVSESATKAIFIVYLEHLLFQKVQQMPSSWYNQSICCFRKCNKNHFHGIPRASPVSESGTKAIFMVYLEHLLFQKVQQRPSS